MLKFYMILLILLMIVSIESYKEIISFEYNTQHYDVRGNIWADFMVCLCGLFCKEDPVLFQHSIIENPEFSNKISGEYKNS